MAEKALQKMEPQPLEAQNQSNQSGGLLAVIARAASDPNTDVSKMERLYAMLKEENARVAEQRFNAAMAAAQAEMPMILKNARNPSTNSPYAKLEAIAKAILPVIEKYKFSLKFGEADCPNNAKIRVICKVSHDAGDGLSHSETFHIDLSPDDTGAKGAPSKTKIHGEGSTFSYGRRYLTCMIFNLTIIGEDDDGNRGSRPRPNNPDATQPNDPSSEARALAKELWSLIKPELEKTADWTGRDWLCINKFLWRFEILDGGIPEECPNLSPARLREVIARVKKELGK